MQIAVKIPKNGASRLSEDVWILGEALSRYHKTSNLRVALESAVRNYSDRLMSDDPSFVQVLNQVKAEGIEAAGVEALER
jgi:hypothetical protein